MTDEHHISKELDPKKKTKMSFKDIQKYRIKKELQYRKDKKEKLIRSKRYKHLDNEDFESTDSGSESEFSKEDYKIIKNSLYSNQKEDLLNGLKVFSRGLTSEICDYEDIIVEKWSKRLIKLLQSTDEEILYHAICCITNIAAGSTELSDSVVKAVPYLTLLLTNDIKRIKDQAAWAIGNIAGEDPKNISIIIDNGVLSPLTQMLESGDIDFVQTAAFTISNLCRGPNPPLEKLIQFGIIKPLFNHLNNDNDIAEISELFWICVYFSAAKDEKYLKLLLENNISSVLVKYLKICIDDEKLIKYAIPIIRTIGNICSSSLDEGTESLLKENGFLTYILKCIQSPLRIIKKESLWALSGLTAGTMEEAVTVANSGFIPPLCTILATEAYDIRKEAAYSILNICTRSKDLLKKFPEESLMPIFVNFVQNSQDIELIHLGLKYIAWELENNNELFKKNEEQIVEALESVPIKNSEEEELVQMSKLILDTYWNDRMEI